MPDVPRTVRLAGQMTLYQAVDAIDDCLRQAVAEGVTHLLIDIRGMSGFDKPDVVARLGMIRRWASTVRGRLKVAMISPPELNDGERFDIVMAQGLGLDGDVFENEEDAVHWLDQSPSLWTSPPPTF